MALDLLTAAERHAFSPEKHYLGPLCKRAHDGGDGQSWRHKGHGNCVECCRLGAREWKKNNPARAAANTRRRDERLGNRFNRSTHPIAFHVGNSRSRAKLVGLPFDIDTDQAKILWREQGGRCFWTGRELDFAVGGDRHPMRPSLDRIVPALGYSKGNLVWASNFANRARGDLNAAEFAEIMVSMGFPEADHSRLAAAAKSFEARQA